MPMHKHLYRLHASPACCTRVCYKLSWAWTWFWTSRSMSRFDRVTVRALPWPKSLSRRIWRKKVGLTAAVCAPAGDTRPCLVEPLFSNVRQTLGCRSKVRIGNCRVRPQEVLISQGWISSLTKRGPQTSRPRVLSSADALRVLQLRNLRGSTLDNHSTTHTL